MREFASVTVDPEDILSDGRLNLYPTLHGKGYVEVRIGTESPRVHAKGHIGVIPLNDHITLEVLPRVPLTNLSRILEVSGEAPTILARAVRLYETAGRMYPSLAAVYAAGLRESVEQVLDRGLLKEYERVDEVTSHPRGRVNVGRTAQRAAARGATHQVAISYFHRTVDNPANRCLLYAVWRLSHYVDQVETAVPRRQRRNIRLDLNYAWHALQGVTLDLEESFLEDELVTGQLPLPSLRSYYRPALDLALTVTGREAVLVESSGGWLQLPSLVIDMSRVFEAYVRNVLAGAASRKQWSVEVLDGNLEPPAGGSRSLFSSMDTYVKASPDVVLRSAGVGAPSSPVVVEVKYKPGGLLPDRTDLNQAISYGAAYDAKNVIVVQPRGSGQPVEPGLRKLGTIHGLDVSIYLIDLSKDLATEEAGLAGAVHGLL